MTETPRPAGLMTRRQLRAAVHKIARSYLEVERGLRPPDHLATFFTDREYRRQHILPVARPAVQGPVRPHDIGPVHLARTSAGRIHASVLVRRDSGRWSALVLGLRHIDHTWKVDELDRLEHLRRGFQRQPTTQTPDVDDDRRIRHVEEELLLAKAAQRAVQKRIDHIGDRRTKPARAAAAELDRWANRSDELDAELAVLRRSQQLRHQHRLIAEADLGVAVESTGPIERDGPREVTKPGSADVASIRHATARELLGYRQRWNLKGDGPPLAALPESAEQEADRQRLIEHLHGALQQLQADDRMGPDVTAQEQDLALGLEA